MIPREKLLRRLVLFPDRRTGIDGIRALDVFQGFGLAQNARHLPADRLGHDEGRELPAREDEIADGKLLVGQVLRHALVHALVPAADEDEMVIFGETLGFLLGKDLTARGEQNYPGLSLLANLFKRGLYRLRAQDHSRPAAEWPIVHLLVPAQAEIPQVNQVKFQNLVLPRPA